MNNEGLGQEPQMMEYYQTFPNLNNPETLTTKFTQEDLRNLIEYFIAFRDKNKQIEKIEHIKEDALIDSYHYTYQNRRLLKIIWLKYQDDISNKCQIDFTDDTRHTQCFYKGGALYTEEWFNMKTTDYQFGRYDENGMLIYGEHGSYAPK